MSYSEKLKDPKWQKKRLEILNRDSFKCVKCSDSKSTLHIHHKEYTNYNEPWEESCDNIATLCCFCHDIMHSIQYNESFIGCNFDDINILKFKRGKGSINYMFVSSKKVRYVELLIYRKNVNLIINIGFEEEEIAKIKKIIDSIGIKRWH